MGYCLAAEAVDRGADVTLISGPSGLAPPASAKVVNVETTDEMFKAVKKDIKNCNWLIMAAAPSDYIMKKVSSGKIKKGKSILPLELSPAIDILSSLKSTKAKGQILVGFALETENGIANATAKLRKKGLDMIVLNNLGKKTPFDSDFNEVMLINKSGKTEKLTRMTKRKLASVLIDRISQLK
jgi:phosphopantothenoylcysteine decarboxylase/phosphopantothenate--cysteine ligase